MSILNDFIKASGNDYATIADVGLMGDVEAWVDTGSYALNALISGSIFKGMPNNRSLAIAAESSTGKTFIALATLKQFLSTDENAIGVIFESEGAISKDMLVERGIDPKRVAVIPVVTVQEFKTQCLRIAKKYEETPKKERQPVMFVLDSLGMLSTTKEIEESEKGSETKDMTRAQLLKATFRVLTLKLNAVNIPLIVTNHVYDSIGGMYPTKVVAGGSGLVYSSSTILMITKAKEKDSEGNQKGVVLTFTATKSRFTKENSKVKCMLNFDTGLDRYYWLTELAVEAGIFNKVSTRIELPDGTKLFQKAIEREPEKYFTDDVLKQIDEYCMKKFEYGRENNEEENDDVEYD